MASGQDGSDQKGVEPVFGGPRAGELQISEESSSPHVRNDGHAEHSRSRSPAGELSADVTPDETRIQLCKQSVHACARFGDLEGLQKHIDQRPISVGEQDPQGLTPLHFAASYGEVRAMDILLAAKADPQVQCHEGWIPLFVAARNGYIDCVSTLVKAKADVNATGAGKETALHNAARAEGAEATEWLLAAGAILDQVDADGWTPLHYATRFNNPDALKVLLDAGAGPDVQDFDGWTAMHNAARNGKNRCVEVLIEARGSLTIKTKLGETCLHVACRKGKSKVVEKILQEAKRSQQIAQLLQEQDNAGYTPENVTEFDYIRTLLQSQGAVVEDPLYAPSMQRTPSSRSITDALGMTQRAPSGGKNTARNASSSCTIL